MKKITEETLKAGLTDPSVQVKVEGNNFKLPNNLQIGQQLEEIDLDYAQKLEILDKKFYGFISPQFIRSRRLVIR